MKKIFLTCLIFFNVFIISVVETPFNMLKLPSFNEAFAKPIFYYFNEQHTEEISYFFCTNLFNEKKSLYTINLGKNKPNFNFLAFVNAQGFFISCEHYDFKSNINPSLPKLPVFFNDTNQVEIFNEHDLGFIFYLNYAICNCNYQFTKSEINLKIRCGVVWHQKADYYYLQILLYQFVDTSNLKKRAELTNLLLSLSLGTYIKLSY